MSEDEDYWNKFPFPQPGRDTGGARQSLIPTDPPPRQPLDDRDVYRLGRRGARGGFSMRKIPAGPRRSYRT